MAITAKELSAKQTKYDVLFHRKRVFDIDSGRLAHLDGSFVKELRSRSVSIISNPCEGYRTVDLEDQELLKELDAFGLANPV